MIDRRINKTYRIVDTKGNELGTMKLLKKIGPGYFQAVKTNRVWYWPFQKKYNVYSCQLQGEIEEDK